MGQQDSAGIETDCNSEIRQIVRHLHGSTCCCNVDSRKNIPFLQPSITAHGSLPRASRATI